MDAPTAQAREVDLHRLDLRFADARPLERERSNLWPDPSNPAASSSRVSRVAEDGNERPVLVDGYRRIEALRRLKRDTA